MIRLLAPTTVESASEDEVTLIFECDKDTARALAAAVQIAYGDPPSVPAEYEAAGSELWDFFTANIPE